MASVVAMRSRVPGDGLIDEKAVEAQPGHPMDAEPIRRELSKLLGWYYYERERQATNRLEMALDADFYDGLQWDDNDKAVLLSRGQMPLVYNEVAPMVDWLIGTERRAKVDWRVLPRAESGVEMADIKTKVLKYVSDINRTDFARSRAFADAIKVGVGWLDDGVRDDPTQDAVYSKYEDWRNILWDSANSYEMDLSDARYVFRWRWVDEDVALAMFPDRADVIRRASEDDTGASMDYDEDGIPTGPGMDSKSGGLLIAMGTGVVADTKRRRVRLFECQYRVPTLVKIVDSGPRQGDMLRPDDAEAIEQIVRDGGTLIERVAMRVHVAIFTPSHMLSWAPSIFRHNRFSLTPIWCYRRGRDRMPYGAIRRVRDIQQDLNKRASKALFLLNTNQVIADEGAVDDWNVARDEIDRPDGTLIKKAGKEFTIRRDTDAATGQINMMALAAQSIQKTAGISNENLGRQTNATSGEAIKARQIQGSVVTTEPFDNLRLAVQAQGEKQLSLIEQWYTQEKVIRLIGGKNEIEWIKVNYPEADPDGYMRVLNDITASKADFVVAEQDYSGTLRQAMFDSLNQIAGRLPPEVALRLMTMAFEFSDMPNKDEIVEQLRRVTGERDPNQEPTEEERLQMDQAQAQQQAMLQVQQEQMVTQMQLQQAQIREINARAGKLEAEGQAVTQIREKADAEITRLTLDMQRVQNETAIKVSQIKQDADIRVEVARIAAEADLKVAQIKAASDGRLRALRDQIGV